MKKVIAFLWLVWFTRLEIGGNNGSIGFYINDSLPLSGFNSESKPASDSKAFTSATNDCFERKSTVLCQGILWKLHHFPVSFFVFLVSFFACGLEWFS
jgi:hypothetical protein